jgi:hypothetical protein
VLAAMHGHESTVRLLLEWPHNPPRVSSRNGCALNCANLRHDDVVIEMLQQAQALQLGQAPVLQHRLPQQLDLAPVPQQQQMEQALGQQQQQKKKKLKRQKA